MKDGKREFPLYVETVQRCWTAFKIVFPDLHKDKNDIDFWLHWVQRAELSTHALFFVRLRRFPESQEEYEDKHSGELLIQAKAKVTERGYDLTWSKDEGFVLHGPEGGVKIHLQGPISTGHPFKDVQ